jgi:hypothetical protein
MYSSIEVKYIFFLTEETWGSSRRTIYILATIYLFRCQTEYKSSIAAMQYWLVSTSRLLGAGAESGNSQPNKVVRDDMLRTTYD